MKGIAGEQMSDHLSLTIFFIPTSTIKMDALKKHLLASRARGRPGITLMLCSGTLKMVRL
jgi:hypothetical protein